MRSLLAAVVSALVIPLLGPAAVASTPEAGQVPASTAAAQCRRTLPAYPEIAPGTTSKAVRALQCVLNDTQFGPVTVDGFYGPETKAAIKELTGNFEGGIENRFLVRTWYWTILFSQSHKLRGLELGDSGIRVKTLQRALRADGETLVVDGDFGPQTRAQVKVFQTKCDIRVTGRVNDQTSFFLSQGGCNEDNAS
jgi:peptidoglycan hydrolase-like protein with peptidoglycan-binding domain